MFRIMLAGRDWRPRALLRAQLLEEGFDVEAHDSIAVALDALGHAKTLPQLLIADVAESSDPAGDIENLSAWTRLIPVWLLASRNVLDESSLGGKAFERTFSRPLDLSALIGQIKRRLSNP